MNQVQRALSALNDFKVRLDRLGSLSDEAWSDFAACIHSKTFKKDSTITVAGEVERNIYFIVRGAVRVYVISDGKEISTNFRFDHQFTSSLTSFLTRKPSQYFLTTSSETEVLYFNHTDLYRLYAKHVELNTLGRVIMEILLKDKRQRELDFLTLSAEQRYNKLLADHPDYIRNIPLKHIASYLGIAPESLSRIRAK